MCVEAAPPGQSKAEDTAWVLAHGANATRQPSAEGREEAAATQHRWMGALCARCLMTLLQPLEQKVSHSWDFLSSLGSLPVLLLASPIGKRMEKCPAAFIPGEPSTHAAQQGQAGHEGEQPVSGTAGS